MSSSDKILLKPTRENNNDSFKKQKLKKKKKCISKWKSNSESGFDKRDRQSDKIQKRTGW